MRILRSDECAMVSGGIVPPNINDRQPSGEFSQQDLSVALSVVSIGMGLSPGGGAMRLATAMLSSAALALSFESS